MKFKAIFLTFLLVLLLPASLSCAKSTAQEQSTYTAVPTTDESTTAFETTAVVTTAETTTAAVTTAAPSGSAVTRMYFDAIKEVYSEDTGLNGGISIISLDLSGANNLSAEEKEDLRDLVSSEYSFDIYTYTYDELVEQGLVDDKNLYFEKGLLFEITDNAITDNAFTFQISKWRSGLGALYYTDCSAKKTGDSWEYSLGGFAIA